MGGYGKKEADGTVAQSGLEYPVHHLPPFTQRHKQIYFTTIIIVQNKIFRQIIAAHETGAAILVPKSSRPISSLQLGTKPSALGCSTRLPCARTAGNCSLHLNGEIRSGFARHLARDRTFYSKRER